MKKPILTLSLLLLFVPFVDAQKVKKKDVKRALEQGKITGLTLLTDNQFTPGTKMEFDLQATLEGGAVALASDFDILWEAASLTVDNAPYKIQGEFLAKGKGVLKPNDAPFYYPNKNIRITAEVAGRKTEKELPPSYCYANSTILKRGGSGSSGNHDLAIESNSGRGVNGSDGAPGPDLQIEVKEEKIGDVLHVVLSINGENYPLDPACSKVSVVSRGGDGGSGSWGLRGESSSKNDKGEYTQRGRKGGNGGDGGRGGNGGMITVSGLYEKYRNVVTFSSEGGEGGDAGTGGAGGSGSTDGADGIDGRAGADGGPGQVVFKNP